MWHPSNGPYKSSNMCNHGNLSISRSVSAEEFKEAVDRVRDEVLMGHFNDVEPGRNRRFLTLEEHGCHFIINLVRLSGDRTLIDIPYKHGPMFMWWLQDRVWHSLQTRLGGQVCDESGRSDQIYPELTYADWVQRAHSAKADKILEYELEYVKALELPAALISDFGLDVRPTQKHASA